MSRGPTPHCPASNVDVESKGSLVISLVLVELGKLPPKVSKFWFVVEHDIQVVRMMGHVVLMVGLRRIKSAQRNDFSYDRTLEDFVFLHLCNIRIGDALLFAIGVKDD